MKNGRTSPVRKPVADLEKKEFCKIPVISNMTSRNKSAEGIKR